MSVKTAAVVALTLPLLVAGCMWSKGAMMKETMSEMGCRPEMIGG